VRNAIALAALLAAALPPGGARAGDGPIQDNSFLLEEAYNQEPGVVQHISAFSRTRGTGAWLYTFTEEWPLGGLEHQGSVTLPLQRASAADPAGLGEILLNYRWQAVGDGEAPVACAPRLSLVLPTGNADRGRGYGGTGLQAGLPLSVVLGSRLVTHVNAGATWVPSARASGATGSVVGWSFGQSLVWLLHPSVNLLAEALYAETEVRSLGAAARTTALTVSPGVRGALDLPGELQVVAGAAVPMGLGPSRGERSLFLYLSFEHPFPGLPRE
jgi:hypothetical protein